MRGTCLDHVINLPYVPPCIEIPDNGDPNDGWSMINTTMEDITMEDPAATDTALADNPTDNSVANQSDILTAAADPTISNKKNRVSQYEQIRDTRLN